MGRKDSITSENKLKVLIIGCTRLTRRIIASVEKTNPIVGVVNLHPEEGMLKSNYDTLSEFNNKNPDKFYMTHDINDDETYSWIKNKEPWAAKYSDAEFINYRTDNLANFLKEINEYR